MTRARARARAAAGCSAAIPSTSAFSSMIPQTLTNSIMSSGGLGVAIQLAKALDPSIGSTQGAKK